MSRPTVIRSLLMVGLFLTVMVPSTISAQEAEPLWRSNGLDPTLWEDRPDTEDSPMMKSYTGNAIIELQVTYSEGHGSGQSDGIIIIELFEQWAPITTDNMISHVESGLYDGIFFHRVINDFVTQSGDPTCKTIVLYPATSPSCGSGGTGETIPLELNENLSHVDGALGMARSQDPDSADAQWYIAETEAHNLDPENRDDEGYATFGIVRDGMTHIRAIAETPTSDEPTGTDLDNPFASGGRPVYEAKIISMEMIGVADPDGVIRNPPEDTAQSNSFAESAVKVVSISLVLLLVVAVPVILFRGRSEEPLNMYKDAVILDAELVDSPQDGFWDNMADDGL